LSDATEVAREGLFARLQAAEARLAALAADPPTGLTEADPKTGERWDAGQAWAHLAEFVPYWIGQIRRVLEPTAEGPVSFGRLIGDPGRVGAIESGRGEPVATQMARLGAAIGDARAYLSGLDAAAWRREGTHPTLGQMDVAGIVERFVVGHLEEHAEQLETLERATERA
jgi:hypothetical protein